MIPLFAAEGFTEQAEVTQWPQRLLLIGIMLGLIALTLAAMRMGWRRRQARQAHIPAPESTPALTWTPIGPKVDGLFLGTALSGDWLDRVAVHGLGVRSRGSISWGAGGVLIEREGAGNIFISEPLAVRVDSGIAGTVRAKGSVLVVTYRLGEVVVESGFRADVGAEHMAVLDGVMAMVGEHSNEG
ncbi:MAG: hypothetical protein RJB01_912 [Actinomycetota bacterium]|jgi:hypothetical protein